MVLLEDLYRNDLPVPMYSYQERDLLDQAREITNNYRAAIALRRAALALRRAGRDAIADALAGMYRDLFSDQAE